MSCPRPKRFSGRRIVMPLDRYQHRWESPDIGQPASRRAVIDSRASRSLASKLGIVGDSRFQ